MTSVRDPLVIFTPSGKRGRFPKGTKLLAAARELGVYVESVCGGRAICGRCQVHHAKGVFAKHGVTSKAEHISAPGDAEKRYAAKRGLAADRRLSCSTEVLGDCVIDIPAATAVNQQVVRKRAEARDIVRDLATRLCYAEIAPPDMDKPLGDADRLIAQLEADWGYKSLTFDFPLLPRVQKILRDGGFRATAALFQDRGPPVITGLWPGFKETHYGAAFDIGSTTIAGHPIDLMTGEPVASAGAANPQIRFGEDLMSRVSYVMMNPDGREGLTKAVREAVNSLILELAAEARIEAADIAEAVFVGNPVMHHLFLGIDPTELGGAPFALAASGAQTILARDLGLAISPSARVYMPPCIAGHVGADAASVTLSEAPHRGGAVTLVVDVGTNAEIVLGNKNRLLAASSPTGPAFEGAEISSGQRAAPGAIERVRINPETFEARIRVIGSELWSDEPGFAAATAAIGVTGLCGSAIIEAVAEMFLAGIITQDGVIDGALAARSPRITQNGRTHSYLLWQGAQEIRVTQNDVRAIQLAKAALYACAKLLMEKLGVSQVDAIKFAGAFGSFIDPKYAMVLGLIPDCDLAKVSAVGNAAGTGARMALLSRAHRREVEDLVRQVEKIETAMEPRFQQHFVAAMGFPNSEDAFPNLGKAVALPARKAGDASGKPRRRAR